MVLDLKSIFAGDNPVRQIDYKFDMSDCEFSGIFPLKQPVTAKGTISNKASVVSLLLEIWFDYSAPCDRCGLETVKSHKVTVDKILAASIEGEVSDTIIIVPDMKLDLDELIYSEVILNVPTKHLCNNNCKGICPQCGKNLNEGDCTCLKKEIDPRLSKLKELLDN